MVICAALDRLPRSIAAEVQRSGDDGGLGRIVSLGDHPRGTKRVSPWANVEAADISPLSGPSGERAIRHALTEMSLDKWQVGSRIGGQHPEKSSSDEALRRRWISMELPTMAERP